MEAHSTAEPVTPADRRITASGKESRRSKLFRYGFGVLFCGFVAILATGSYSAMAADHRAELSQRDSVCEQLGAELSSDHDFCVRADGYLIDPAASDRKP